MLPLSVSIAVADNSRKFQLVAVVNKRGGAEQAEELYIAYQVGKVNVPSWASKHRTRIIRCHPLLTAPRDWHGLLDDR